MTATGEPAGAPGPEQARIPPYLQARPAAARPEHDEHTAAGARPPADPQQPTTRPRPFVLASGRVHSVDPEVGLETQVTASRVRPPWAAPVSSLAPELQTIIALCAEPISVAEISARVPLHLGVAKVLVGDLRAAGHLDVHDMDAADPHDPDTILRVIRGLRAIA